MKTYVVVKVIYPAIPYNDYVAGEGIQPGIRLRIKIVKNKMGQTLLFLHELYSNEVLGVAFRRETQGRLRVAM